MVAGRRPITSTRSDRNTASRMLWVTKTTVLRLACQMRSSSTAHLVARDRVERAERLVHQQDARIVHERPADRGALAHAARELARQHAGEFVDLRHAQQLAARAASYCARGSRSSSIGKQHVVAAPCATAAAPGSGTRRRPRGAAPRPARPLIAISPSVGPISPAIIISNVLLPQPLGPSTLRNSPSATSKETSRIASRSP